MTVRRYGGTEMLVAVVHARNSFRMRSYKIIGLKVPWNHTLPKKEGEGGGETEFSVTAASSGSGREASSNGWRALRQTCTGCRGGREPWSVGRAPNAREFRWRANHGVWRGRGFRGRSRSARCAAAQRRCARVRGRRL